MSDSDTVVCSGSGFLICPTLYLFGADASSDSASLLHEGLSTSILDSELPGDMSVSPAASTATSGNTGGKTSSGLTLSIGGRLSVA